MTTMTQTKHIWLSVAATAIGAPFIAFCSLLFIFTTMTSVNRLPPPLLAQPFLIVADLMVILPFSILISDVGRYVLLSLTGMGLTVAALGLTRPRGISRAVLLMALLAIVALPFVNPYRPAVSAAPGYVMHIPTQPNLLEGVTKQAAASAEYRPCAYKLFGWSADHVLYYQSTCDMTIQTWAFSMNRTSAQPVSALPANLIIKYPNVSVVDWVRADGVRPIEAEPSTRRLYVREGGLASPDGRWVALIARHVYGPEDVLVVGPR